MGLPNDLWLCTFCTPISHSPQVGVGRPRKPGQHGAKPAELVVKEVLHQRARFAHLSLAISRISIAMSPGRSRAIASAPSPFPCLIAILCLAARLLPHLLRRGSQVIRCLTSNLSPPQTSTHGSDS